MENVFIFSPIQDYFSKFESAIKSDLDFLIKRLNDEYGELLYIEWLEHIRQPFCDFRKKEENEKYFDIDLPPEILNSIKSQIIYKEIFSLGYNSPELLNYLIMNHFDDELYINPFFDKLYSVKYLKELLIEGNKIYIYSDNILEPEEWD